MVTAVKHAPHRPAPHSATVSSSKDGPAAARETLMRATKALALNFDGVLAGEGESIHQFRISVRKLRGLLELYQPLLQQNWFNRQREELRFLGHSVGALRDSDVLQQNLGAVSADIDASLREPLTPLHVALTERRRQQLEEASALLRSPRYEALVQNLPAATFKQAPLPNGRVALPELIQPLVRAVERAGAKLSRRSSPGEFHRLRIRIKRLRYALEMVDGGRPKHLKRAAKKLKNVQEILGTQHDLETAIGWLREFAASAEVPGPSLLAAGALYQVLHRGSRKLSRRAWKKWKTVRAGAPFQGIVAELPDRVRRLHDTGKVDAA